MRTFTLVGGIALWGWLATATLAQDGIHPGSAITPDVATDAVSTPRADQGTNPVSTGAAEKSGDSWRYVRYNNQWWYYLPNKQWVVWNGGRWVTPAEMPRQAAVNQRPYRTGYRGSDIYYPGPSMNFSQPAQDPTLGRPIYRRFFPNMPFVPFPEDPTTSQPVTGAGQR